MVALLTACSSASAAAGNRVFVPLASVDRAQPSPDSAPSTATPTNTPTAAPTNTPTPMQPTQTSTPTPSPTSTPVPATATATPTPDPNTATDGPLAITLGTITFGAINPILGYGYLSIPVMVAYSGTPLAGASVYFDVYDPLANPSRCPTYCVVTATTDAGGRATGSYTLNGSTPDLGYLAYRGMVLPIDVFVVYAGRSVTIRRNVLIP